MSESANTPKPAKSADIRRALRSPLLVLRVKLKEGGRSFFGYAKNISRSGLFIASVNPREPGERFHLEIPLPAPLSRTLECTGEVVWKRNYKPDSPYEPGMGLKFLDLQAEEEALLDRWVRDANAREEKK
jgi:uncharacterized protein (TIGR02266 family)